MDRSVIFMSNSHTEKEIWVYKQKKKSHVKSLGCVNSQFCCNSVRDGSHRHWRWRIDACSGQTKNASGIECLYNLLEVKIIHMFKFIYLLYCIGLYTACIYKFTNTEWSGKVNIHFRKLTDVWIQIVLLSVGKVLKLCLKSMPNSHLLLLLQFFILSVTVSRNSGKINRNVWIMY